MDAYIAVVGGVNIDVGGRSFSPLVSGDSNPGVIRSSLGGVGRNIAHNLALLGVPVKLVTALGDDDGARRVRESCRDLGIDLLACTAPDAATGSYLFLCAPDGDMAMAVSDMEVFSRLTPDWLGGVLPVLNNAALVVLDANLPAEALDFLAQNVTAPIFADPVSAAKAPRMRGALGSIHTLKPNRIEAAVLSGVPITDEESLLRASDVLLGTGLRRVFITLGQDGVLAAEGDARVRLPNPPVTRRVNASGCGDAFTAALCWAALRGAGLEESARCALAAASVAMESAETVNPDMSEDMIRSRMENHNAYFESLS